MNHTGYAAAFLLMYYEILFYFSSSTFFPRKKKVLYSSIFASWRFCAMENISPLCNSHANNFFSLCLLIRHMLLGSCFLSPLLNISCHWKCIYSQRPHALPPPDCQNIIFYHSTPLHLLNPLSATRSSKERPLLYVRILKLSKVCRVSLSLPWEQCLGLFWTLNLMQPNTKLLKCTMHHMWFSEFYFSHSITKTTWPNNDLFKILLFVISIHLQMNSGDLSH